MKCIVKDCTNHRHEGKFVGNLCSPCFTFLITGEGTYSQAYKSTVLKEREACAKVCDELHPGLATKRAAEIIRARGEASIRSKT